MRSGRFPVKSLKCGLPYLFGTLRPFVDNMFVFSSKARLIHRHPDATVMMVYRLNSADIHRQYLRMKSTALLFCTTCVRKSQVVTPNLSFINADALSYSMRRAAIFL